MQEYGRAVTKGMMLVTSCPRFVTIPPPVQASPARKKATVIWPGQLRLDQRVCCGTREGVLSFLLPKLEVAVQEACHNADVYPYEVVRLVHVVPAHVHPYVRHDNVLDAADDSVRERRDE